MRIPTAKGGSEAGCRPPRKERTGAATHMRWPCRFRRRGGHATLRLWVWLLASIGLFVLCSAADAQTMDQIFADWMQQPYMTGDWGGLRTKLADEGILLRAHYLSETAGNPTGGLRQGTQYAQQIDFGADLDLGKLIDLQGGVVHVTFTDRQGQSLAADDVGNLISEQEIFGGGQNFRFAELSYAQSLFQDRFYGK